MNKQQFATLAIGIKSAYPASKILEDNASMDFWYMNNIIACAEAVVVREVVYV